MLFWVNQRAEKRVAEASVVIVLNIDDRLLLFEIFWQRLERRASERCELCDLKERILDADEHKPRSFAAEVRVRLLNLEIELLDRFVDLELVEKNGRV